MTFFVIPSCNKSLCTKHCYNSWHAQPKLTGGHCTKPSCNKRVRIMQMAQISDSDIDDDGCSSSLSGSSRSCFGESNLYESSEDEELSEKEESTMECSSESDAAPSKSNKKRKRKRGENEAGKKGKSSCDKTCDKKRLDNQ